jgi:CRISPR/Cas system-associated exonuclease Cas4 (RecB family)
MKMDSKKELDLFEIMKYMELEPKKVYRFLSELNESITQKLEDASDKNKMTDLLETETTREV